MQTSLEGQVRATADGSLTLVHSAHGEAYHSDAGAALEARDLYVGASGLRERFASPNQLHPLGILDIGLGLGYNAMATIGAWMEATSPPPLHLVSLELDEDLFRSFLTTSAPWQRDWPRPHLDWIAQLREHGGGGATAMFPHPIAPQQTLHWEIMLGDARATDLGCRTFDYFWQDPFSPQKNPDLWSLDWFSKLAAASRPGAILMTYSVARSVRDHVSQTGWHVERIPTTTHKKHWLRAKMR